MRAFFFISLLLLAAMANAQLPAAVQKPVVLLNTNTDKLTLKLLQEGPQHFVELSGNGWGTVTISEGDEAILVFADKSNIKLRSAAMQSFDYNAVRQTYTHRYAIADADLPKLASSQLVSVRKSSFGEWSNIAIPTKGAEAIKLVATAFNPTVQEEQRPAKATPSFYTINPEQIAKYAGDSVGFCARVLTADVIGGTTLLQLQHTAGIAQAVIPANASAAFPVPGTWYAGKDVCLSGVVHSVNNVPQLVLRSRQALRVTSTLTDADAALFVGDSITLTGTVSSANYLSSSATKPTLLNTGGAYPNQALTVMIAQSDRAAFGGQPEQDFLAKKIQVSGVVTMYKGKPQIVVSQKGQLRLVETPSTATTVTAKPPVVVAKEPTPTPQLPPATNRTTVPTSIDIEPAARREKIADNSQYGETLATYPGGDAAQQAFLRGRLQCPASAGDETKTVIVSFQVENDGAIDVIRIEKSGGKAYDAAVLQALQQMPKWKPRSRNGYTTLDKLYQTFTFYCAKQRGA